MYHRSVDRRVGDFCRNAGFAEVIELESGRWKDLAPDLAVMCGESGSGDTWLCARSERTTLLNINDGVLERHRQLERILRAIGGLSPDVLLSQFSYTNWVGNPEDVEVRRREARAHLDRLALQCSVLRPRYIVPFASMVWFCHEENFYLNADMNSIADAYHYLQEHVEAQPIVLFLGEVWEPGERHDSEAALRSYEPYYEALKHNPELIAPPLVEVSELERLAARFFKMLRRNNPGWALAGRLRLLRPARVFLWDHNRAFELSRGSGLQPISLPQKECDVAVASESLAYCLRFLWGGATLHVNGRFRTPAGGRFSTFYRYMLIANYNNRGWTVLSYVPVLLARIRDRLDGRGVGDFEQRA